MQVAERRDRGIDQSLRRVPVGDVLMIGDGLAARRSICAIEHFFGEGERAPEFRGGQPVDEIDSAPDTARVIRDFAA